MQAIHRASQKGNIGACKGGKWKICKNRKMHKTAREKIYEFSHGTVVDQMSFYIDLNDFIFFGKNYFFRFLDLGSDTSDDAK